MVRDLPWSVAIPPLPAGRSESYRTPFPACGNGVYSYQWSVEYFIPPMIQTLGTAKTQSLDVAAETGHFEMRVRVSSASVQDTDTHFVNNNINPGPEFRRRPSLRGRS